MLDEIALGDRAREDLGDIDRLTESIAKHGIITPIAVCKLDEPLIEDSKPKTYKLIAGGRRLLAAARLGMVCVPVQLYDSSLDELSLKRLELEENVARKDMHWTEVAKLIEVIHKEHERRLNIPDDRRRKVWTQEQTATLLGVTQGVVSNALTLAEGLREYPELAELKNISAALKQLKFRQSGLVEELLGDADDYLSERRIKEIRRLRSNFKNSLIVAKFAEQGLAMQKFYDLVMLDDIYLASHENDKIPTSNLVTNLVLETGWLFVWGQKDYTLKDLLALNRDLVNWFEKDFKLGYWRKVGFLTGKDRSSLGHALVPFFYTSMSTKSYLAKPNRSCIIDARPTDSGGLSMEIEREVLRVFVHPGSRILIPYTYSVNTLFAAANCQDLTFASYTNSQPLKDFYDQAIDDSPPGNYLSVDVKTKEEKSDAREDPD